MYLLRNHFVEAPNPEKVQNTAIRTLNPTFKWLQYIPNTHKSLMKSRRETRTLDWLAEQQPEQEAFGRGAMQAVDGGASAMAAAAVDRGKDPWHASSAITTLTQVSSAPCHQTQLPKA